MPRLVSKIIIWVIAAFYAYGAVVHILNMLSLTGFNWLSAPLKWQVLDVVYFLLDGVVALGFVLAWRVSYAVFLVTALSQIVLYTALRTWITDVPLDFALTPEQIAYLDVLVVFHVVTILMVVAALCMRMRSCWPRSGQGQNSP